MTAEKKDVKTLTDLELMRYLLQNEQALQVVQVNIQELRVEMARRVNEEPNKVEPNDTSNNNTDDTAS